jgi:hypothetical protein
MNMNTKTVAKGFLALALSKHFLEPGLTPEERKRRLLESNALLEEGCARIDAQPDDEFMKEE